MAQTPDPKLIDSMAMRYRHDFGLLDEPQKEAIRTTMRQLWEEVVGLGFYKSSVEKTAQHTALEQFWEQIAEILPFSVDSVTAIRLYDKLQEAKQMERYQHGDTWDAAIKAYEDRGNLVWRSICDFDDYYNETYGNNTNK